MIHHDIDAGDDDSLGLLPGYALCSPLMPYLHKGPGCWMYCYMSSYMYPTRGRQIATCMCNFSSKEQQVCISTPGMNTGSRPDSVVAVASIDIQLPRPG